MTAIDLTNEEFARAVNHYSARLGGWYAYVEVMTGCIYFTHHNFPVSVWATPDWEATDTIVVQIDQDNGRTLATTEIPWPREGRTIREYVERVAPLLAVVAWSRTAIEAHREEWGHAP